MTPAQKKYLLNLLRIEKRYVPLFVEAIEAYRSSFIEDLHRQGITTALTNLSPVSPHVHPILDSLYREAARFGALQQQAEFRSMLTARDRAQIAQRKKSASLGIAATWIQRVVDYLNLHLVNLISNITETMRNDIVRILEKATKETWSIQQIVDALKDKSLIEARARVIARTEVIRAANQGHQEAAADVPFEVDKEWDAAGDARTRPSHQAIDGHKTEEHGAFRVPIYKKGAIVGYEDMQRPGDPNATASNVCNCRCRIKFIPKRVANGALQMREESTARIIPLRSPSTVASPAAIAAILKDQSRISVDMGNRE